MSCGWLCRRFATLQIRAIVSTLVRSFKLTAISPLPGIDEKAMVVGPLGKFMVRYERIQHGGSARVTDPVDASTLKAKWGY